MSTWFQDGNSIDCIPVENRAFNYGDGVFETIAIRNGKPRLWSLHMARLIDACDRLRIPAPSVDALEENIHQALITTGVGEQHAIAKIIVAAKFAGRGYGRPDNASAETFIGIFDSQARPDTDYEEGVKTRRCDTAIAIQPALAGIKSLNRLEQVLARNEWDSSEIAEGLMCDSEGRLICGTMSNVFLAKDNAISTPALNRCGVSGVMRRHVIEVLLENNIPVEETDIDWNSAMIADELFLTNSQFGILPIRACDEFEWPVGPVTKRTMKLIGDNGVMECIS